MAEGADAELEPSDESGRRSVDELIPPDASAIGDDLLSLLELFWAHNNEVLPRPRSLTTKKRMS